jgi:hypothetical protein
MQNVLTIPVQKTGTEHSLSVSLGALAALAIFTLALVLRLVNLDTVPMSVRETADALAALRAVWPQTPGDPLASSSAAVFLAQATGFTAFGSGAFAARFGTALAGAFVVVAPLLFQRRLGASWSFAFSVALLLSPTLLLASRSSSADVWALAFAVLTLYAFWRWEEVRRPAWAIAGSVAGASLTMLAGWSGLVLALVLLASFGLARWWGRNDQRFAFDEPATPPRGGLLAGFPWLAALALSALTVTIAGTAFMLYPAGLDSVAAAIGGLLTTFAPLSGPLPAYALQVAVFYESAAWLLGIAAALILWRRGALGPAERFLSLWLTLGAIVSLLFITGPAQALWMAVPMAGLAARLIVELLRADERAGSWIPYSARWISAAVAVLLLFIFTLAFQSFARALAAAPAGDLSAAPIDPASLILMGVMALFSAVMLVLGANLWDWRTVLTGAGLALALFGGVASLGAGWHAAVPNADDPVEPWHFTATATDTSLIADTLRQLQDRQSGGLPVLPIAVQGAQDGVLAWLVRDYPNATFVRDAREAAGAEVLLSDSAAAPELGGAYVGQDFTLIRLWSPRVLGVAQFPAWWTQRVIGPAERATILSSPATLWVRQDVYDGVEPPGRG